MSWVTRAITPHHPPLGPDGVTYNPELTVQTERFCSRFNLELEPIWQQAKLTRRGRAAVLRPAGEFTRPGFLHGWRVKRSGEGVSALVLRLGDHLMRGSVVSTSPFRQRLEYTDKILIVTAEIVLPIRGAYEDRAFGYVGDILLRTHKFPRLRHRDLPEEDLDVLKALAPS